MVVALAVSLLGGSACSDTTLSITGGVDLPMGMAFVCYVDDDPAPWDDCAEGATGVSRYGFVTDAKEGEVLVLDLDHASMVDMLPAVPGYNGVLLEGIPGDIVAAEEGRAVYVSLTDLPGLARVDTASFEVTHIPLDAAPTGMAASPDGEVLYMVTPSTRQLLALALPDGTTPEAVGDPLPHDPYDLVIDEDGEVAYVTYHSKTLVSAVTVATGDRLDIPVGFACGNGVDDDGDGLVDSEDPGCTSLSDFDEADPVEGIGCSNGIDDDEDGLVDLEDPGCLDPFDPTELSDGALLVDGELRDGLELPSERCMNGIDDDGDGLVDYPDDPDCFTPGSSDEAPLAIGPLQSPRIAPGGKWLYVIEPVRKALYVIDLEAGAEVAVNGSDEALTLASKQILDANHITYLPLRYMPTDITFSGTAEAPVAHVATTSGYIYRVAAAPEEGAAHQVIMLQVDTYSRVTKPDLTVGGSSVPLGFALPSAYPSFGDLDVDVDPTDPDKLLSYGIKLVGDDQGIPSESWSLVYEGALPGTSSSNGLVIDDEGTLHDPFASFCGEGVEEGDTVVLSMEPDDGCDDLYPTADVEYLVASRTADTLILEGGSGHLVGDPTITVELPTTACFSAAVSYKVRATEAFVVKGSSSGYLHPWEEEGGACVLADLPEALTSGRAYVSMPKNLEKVFETCPPELTDGDFERHPFANLTFSLEVHPGCEQLAVDAFVVTAPPRDMVWSFTVSSSYGSNATSTTSLPSSIVYSSGDDEVYVLDAGSGKVVSIGVEGGIISTFY